MIHGDICCFLRDSLLPLRGKVRMGGSMDAKSIPPTLILPLKGGGENKRNHASLLQCLIV